LAPRPPSPSSEHDSAAPARPVAVALRYDGADDDAPRVVAKGEGQVAEQIIALARERGIEIREDADLVSLLAAVRLDSPIPIEAYVAVAEILSYIYRRRGRAPQAKS
jgi:flagellar biosynthesis protein